MSNEIKTTPKRSHQSVRLWFYMHRQLKTPMKSKLQYNRNYDEIKTSKQSSLQCNQNCNEIKKPIKSKLQ